LAECKENGVCNDSRLVGSEMEKGLASWVKSFKNAFSFSKRPKAGSEMALPFLCTFQIVILNIQNYHGVNISRACRVKRRTCRLKSDRGSSAVHPRSLREV
jgi:hypothetical protein